MDQDVDDEFADFETVGEKPKKVIRPPVQKAETLPKPSGPPIDNKIPRKTSDVEIVPITR